MCSENGTTAEGSCSVNLCVVIHTRSSSVYPTNDVKSSIIAVVDFSEFSSKHDSRV